MKKLLLNLLAIMFACTSVKGTSITADTTLPCVSAYEPNNTDETAAPIPPNTNIQGAMYPSGDYDVYVINATANAQLHITLQNPAANTYLGIYNPDSGEYDWSPNSGVVDDALDFHTIGGKCYIYVGAYGEPSETCYTLNVGLTYPSLCPDTFEYNDVLDSAKTIAIGQTVAGRISDHIDRDYFRFTVDTTSTISAYMSNVVSEDLQFDLLNANGIRLRSGIYDATNKTKHIFHYGVPAGTYYLETSSQGFAISDECYQLTVSTQPSQECADWYEPNNNDLEAPEISVNTDYISKLQDQDFYLFFVPPGTYYFEVRADGLWPDCRVHVTDYWLNGVGFDHVGYNEDYGSVEVFNGGGEYYIVEVDPYTGGPSSDKCYKLRINVPGALAARTGAPTTKNDAITPVKLYPVPTTGKVFMEINTKGEKEKYITVSDLSGRVLFSQKYGVTDGLNKLEVTLPSTLINGVYIISDGKQSKKILVRR
ncbi:T9SS type A sorting domain-containing protein [Chitinophaga sp. CF418]|uniref:T9SS type A sorting domain-containing protein n=1 Tax=Chitinophaga sp. CF418 TaxID=1855287 RepID=UPI00091B1D56|nr:T9SS type A sorting domain-containing protein [Chitinophaga sp. CF418]SHN33238.1 Por secretion system C-terminal sorting domain-containing protein [Chitinophaga sp. CF418]